MAELIIGLIIYIIGMVILYFVVKAAVRSGINESDLFSVRNLAEQRKNIADAINKSNVKKEEG